MQEYSSVMLTDKQRTNFKRTFLIEPDKQFVNVDTPAKEIHAIRSNLRKLSRDLIDRAQKENRNMTDVETDACDAALAYLDDCQRAFDYKSERAEAATGIARAYPGGPGSQMVNTGSSRGAALEYWEDTQTNRAIPVLGKEHRFQDFYPSTPGQSISSRDYFASMVGHRVSAESRATMMTGSDVQGGFMVPQNIAAEIIDLLRAKNVVTQAGARTIPLPAQTCRVCRITSDPTAAWVPESTLIPEDASMEIGALEFNAHKLTCLIKASRELLQDANNAGTVIMNAIASAMALELDSAALMGDGNGKPQGIHNNPHINTYSIGGNGSNLNGFSDLLYGVREIVNVNGPIPTTAVMAPRTLVGYSLIMDGEGKPIVRPDLIKNIVFMDTTKIPVDQTQGTSHDCSSIILGTFSELVIGIRLVLEIQVLNERYADEGKVGFLATMRADTAVYQPKAFCKVIGIKP